MGTSNFSRPNASKVFACLMSEDVFICEDCGDYSYETTKCESCGSTNGNLETRPPDDCEVEEFRRSVRTSLSEIPNVYYRDKEGYCHRRSKINLATLIVEKVFAGVSIEIVLEVTMELGYYAGAQLDWDLTYYADGYENDTEPIEEWKYQALKEHNAGLVRMLQPKVEKWLEKAKNKLIEDVENVFTEVTTPLIRVATFSNGESIYQKA